MGAALTPVERFRWAVFVRGRLEDLANAVGGFGVVVILGEIAVARGGETALWLRESNNRGGSCSREFSGASRSEQALGTALRASRLDNWRLRRVLHQAVGGVRRRAVLLDGGAGGFVGGHLLGEPLDMVLGEVRRDRADVGGVVERRALRERRRMPSHPLIVR